MAMRRTLLVLLFFISILVASEGYKRKRVTIPDDLDDVVHDEDDDAWEQWGLKKSGSGPDKNLPPPNFSKMDPSKIQELMKQHTGPSYGFVKLRFGVSRSKVDVQNIATKWSKMLKTGSIDVRFMATDLNTFMFTMEKGQDLEELKEFILSQRDAYEVKIGDQTYRRPGDPPLDQVIERLRREKHSSGKSYNNEL